MALANDIRIHVRGYARPVSYVPNSVASSGKLRVTAQLLEVVIIPVAVPKRSSRSGVSLDEAEHFLHNRDASVATLRWCSDSSRNAVRIPSGTCVQLRRNPHRAQIT